MYLDQMDLLGKKSSSLARKCYVEMMMIWFAGMDLEEGLTFTSLFLRFGTVVTLHPTIKIRCKEIPFPNVYDHVQLAFQEQPEVPGMDLAESWIQVLDVRHSRCHYWKKGTDKVQWDIPASEAYCDSEHLQLTQHQQHVQENSID